MVELRCDVDDKFQILFAERLRKSPSLALAFGNMDPDGHPGRVSLGMQIASELKGSFLGGNTLGDRDVKR
jgi:hypothetical protein